MAFNKPVYEPGMNREETITEVQLSQKQRGKTAGRNFGQTTFFQDTRSIVMQESKPKASRSFAYFLLI